MGGLASFNSIPLGAVGGRVPFTGDADPFGILNFFDGVFRGNESLRQGIVLNYNPQTHSAMVHIQGEQVLGDWPCVFADELLSYSFGFSITHPPREGEFVLVAQVQPGVPSGIVVGRLPYMWYFGIDGDQYNDPDQYHRRSYTQDDMQKRTWDRNIPCYTAPFGNKDDSSTHLATHFRPTDVYPGEFANLNQHNCGLKGGLFSATLLGGGASLRMSALTNAARLACESYMRYSMLGSLHEFHNGRYLSMERKVAMYQEERLGGSEKEDRVWEDDSEAPAKGENQTMRPRMLDLSGFFGHLSSKFCFRPDPNETDIRDQGKSNPTEAGVSRETVDPSGQYRLSAAGMLTIERTGRIPIPVRKAYPTDKDHDIGKDPETLKPFFHDAGDPCYRQLELFDRQAYDLKNQYARVDGLGDEKNADYEVPQEEDLQPLRDKYDEKFTKSETVRLEKYDKRRAGMYIGEDGSVIIRDAWGSEIVMIGGNVTISCAGNAMILPGKTQLTIAGDDIVQKAQNSVDIHASEHDVRLSAARNMEIIGGADESNYQGGVIIEAKGQSASPWDGKDQGEGARLHGITLKADKQAVVVDGERVNIRSRKDTRIISGDKDIDGMISIAAKMVRSKAKYNIAEDMDGTAGHYIMSGGVMSIADSVTLVGHRSVTPISGGKYPVPIMMVDVGDVSQPNQTTDLKDEKSASAGFDSEALEKMIFGFRKSYECGTTEPWSIGASGYFKMYEPAWVQVLGIYETLTGIESKSYEEKGEWGNGKPFPGEEEKGSYACLAGMKPVNLTSDGLNKSRKSVEQQSSITELSMDDYKIRT